jgi:hypothetical protein
MIVREKGLREKHKMESMLQSCSGKPLIAALCGYIFEPYAIRLLEKGGTFICRELVHGDVKDKPGNFDLVIPASPNNNCQVVDKVETNQNINQLYVPKTKTYTAIDAWMPGVGGFQMTVGRRHEINGDCGGDLSKLGAGGNKLYWLLPPLYYYEFTKKTPQTIEQYAILIFYAENNFY